MLLPGSFYTTKTRTGPRAQNDSDCPQDFPARLWQIEPNGETPWRT
jgi:hypothetical protein